jgi:hypothetical protein
MTVNGHSVEFVNTCAGNRSGFYHETSLYIDRGLVITKRNQYYNRTWESYQFQSVMRCALSQLREKAFKDYVEDYKESHNVKRVSAEKREQLERFFRETPYGQLLIGIGTNLG